MFSFIYVVPRGIIASLADQSAPSLSRSASQAPPELRLTFATPRPAGLQLSSLLTSSIPFTYWHYINKREHRCVLFYLCSP